MNEEELKIVKMKELIKKEIEKIGIDALRDQLLNHFGLECQLNDHFNLSSIQVINTLKLFEKKLKFYQQIENDLPNNLILHGDERLLSEKFDILRLQIAILYVDGKESEIAKKNYNEIKGFIFNILNLNINLKLKFFDLTIKLLAKMADPIGNKEFIGALDLLKLFVNENYLPDEESLQYINNLGRQTNDEDIRKSFYGIIYELDAKLLFQVLLNQLLEIIKKHNNSPLKIIKNLNKPPLVQYNIKFITKCLCDPEMDAADFHQLINIVCETLERNNERVKMKTRSEKIINPENLIDLSEFKKDLKEKISAKIIDDLIKHNSQEKKSYLTANILDGLDFVTCFPTCVNNKKIKFKLSETKFDYIKTLEKTPATNDRSMLKSFSERLTKIGNKTYELITNAEAKASDVKENLKNFAENTTERLTDFIKKNSETSYPEENNGEIEEKDMKTSLTEAKEKLLPIKEKLNAWNLTFRFNVDVNNASLNNHIAINQFDANQCLQLVNNINDSINDKFIQWVSQVLNELEEIRKTIKEKSPWFSKSGISRSSLSHKIFRCGYFNSNFTIKKMKVYLNNDLSFDNVNNFILNQSFWSLLSNGIIRWPWMNKIVFAQTWAEQFHLYNVINQVKELERAFRKDYHKEEIFKEVISLSENLFPIQSKITHILGNFKESVIIILEQLEILEKKINNSLNEKENSLFVLSSISKGFFMNKKNCGLASPDTKINRDHFGITLGAY